MSIRLMSLVWDHNLPMSRKMVLLSLADQANDAGEAFPSFANVMRRCGMARRTLFDCLLDLENDGFVTRVPVGVQKVIFQVNEDALRQRELIRTLRDESVKPVRQPHQCEIRTGAKNSKSPVRQPHSIKQPSNSNQEGEPRAPSGTRLPPDWGPSDEDIEFARRERPDVDVKVEAAKFRDYWLSVAGAKGRRADWPATWRNWIRRADAPKGAPAVPANSTPPAKPRDWREPSESPLEHAVAYIRQRFGRGEFGDGPEAEAERDRLIADERRRHATTEETADA